MKIEYDVNKDYYSILNVAKNATNTEITNAYKKWFKDNWESTKQHSSLVVNQYLQVAEAFYVLTDAECKKSYDVAINNVEMDKAAVSSFENNDDLINNNADEVKTESHFWKKFAHVAKYIAAACIIAVGIEYFSNNYGKNQVVKAQSASESPKSSSSDIVDDEVVNDDVNIASETTNEVVEEIDKVNSEEYINETAEIIWNNIEEIKNTNSSFAPSIYDLNTVYELVKWTHHSDKNYIGDYSISNEYAYGLMAELTTNQEFDVSQFFRGLDSYDGINKIWSTFSKISEDNNYEDEYNAYSSVNDVLSNNFDYSNYSEIISIVAILDNWVDTPSMQFMRNGAIENGNEGTEYYSEKESISLTQREECSNIFSKINRESNTYVFGNPIAAALNEDSSLSR